MPTPLNKRPRKIQPRQIDPDLKKAIEDYDDGRVIYDTIEISHPLFDEPFYLVNHTDKVIRTINGKKVHFQNFPYHITLPEIGEKQQLIRVTLDNVEQVVQKQVEKALTDPQRRPLKMVYRVYVEGKDALAMPEMTLISNSIQVSYEAVSIEFGRPDLFARIFPGGERYDSRFKGLTV